MRFTLREDWKDGGDSDKTAGIIQMVIFAIILLVVLFAKVFKGGVHFLEIVGFVVLSASLVFASGILKLEIVEGEKTMWNTVLWLGGALAGAGLMWAAA